MSGLAIEFRPREAQTEFNLRRWTDLLNEPALQKIEGRIETDRHGRMIMSPPPAPEHGRLQSLISALLRELMRDGETITECPISTADGVRAADVAWMSTERWRERGSRSCFVHAPEICVEVISPGNSDEEIREKIALYFDAGAEEVWTCGTFGKMTFHARDGVEIDRSTLCPSFPLEVE